MGVYTQQAEQPSVNPDSPRCRTAVAAAGPVTRLLVEVAASTDAIAVVHAGVARGVAVVREATPLAVLARRAEVARSAIRVDAAVAAGQTGIRREVESRVTAMAGSIRRTVRIAEARVVGTHRDWNLPGHQAATVGAIRAVRISATRGAAQGVAHSRWTIIQTGSASCRTGSTCGTMEQRRARARILSIFRHAGVRGRGADGTTAGLGIRQVAVNAGNHRAHHVADHRRVWLPSVAGSTVDWHAAGATAGRSDQLGPSGTGPGGWGAGKMLADRAVRASSVFRNSGVRIRHTDGTAARVVRVRLDLASTGVHRSRAQGRKAGDRSTGAAAGSARSDSADTNRATRSVRHTAGSTDGATRRAATDRATRTAGCSAADGAACLAALHLTASACTAPSAFQTETATRQADQTSHERG